jgi:hypothetical protein
MKTVRFVAAAGLCTALCACAAPKQETPAVALPPAPPPGEPGTLTGMEASYLRAAFGPPAFVRKDGAIEMWRYDGAACKAFFFLYPGGATLAVRHVETVPRGRDIAADPNCLARLRVNAPVS